MSINKLIAFRKILAFLLVVTLLIIIFNNDLFVDYNRNIYKDNFTSKIPGLEELSKTDSCPDGWYCGHGAELECTTPEDCQKLIKADKKKKEKKPVKCSKYDGIKNKKKCKRKINDCLWDPRTKECINEESCSYFNKKPQCKTNAKRCEWDEGAQTCNDIEIESSCWKDVENSFEENEDKFLYCPSPCSPEELGAKGWECTEEEWIQKGENYCKKKEQERAPKKFHDKYHKKNKRAMEKYSDHFDYCISSIKNIFNTNNNVLN